MPEEIAALQELIAFTEKGVQSERIRLLVTRGEFTEVRYGCRWFLLWLNRYVPKCDTVVVPVWDEWGHRLRDMLDIFVAIGGVACVESELLQFKTHVPDTFRMELADYVRAHITPPEVTSEIRHAHDKD